MIPDPLVFTSLYNPLLECQLQSVTRASNSLLKKVASVLGSWLAHFLSSSCKWREVQVAKNRASLWPTASKELKPSIQKLTRAPVFSTTSWENFQADPLLDKPSDQNTAWPQHVWPFTRNTQIITPRFLSFRNWATINVCCFNNSVLG